MKTRVNILFYAKSRELTGVSTSYLNLNSTINAEELRFELLSAYPRLNQLQNCFALALNEEYIDEDKEIHLKSEDIIAVIPPISGG